MNKEEYAQFHYLLAKLKYGLVENLHKTPSDSEYRKELENLVAEIDDIAKVTFIDCADQ